MTRNGTHKLSLDIYMRKTKKNANGKENLNYSFF